MQNQLTTSQVSEKMHNLYVHLFALNDEKHMFYNSDIKTLEMVISDLTYLLQNINLKQN